MRAQEHKQIAEFRRLLEVPQCAQRLLLYVLYDESDYLNTHCMRKSKCGRSLRRRGGQNKRSTFKLMQFRRGGLIITFVLCLVLFCDLPMSVALMSIIGKHKRIAIGHKLPAAAFRILGLSRPYRPAGMCFSDTQYIHEAAVVILNGGQRGMLRGKSKGGWYSVAIRDTKVGAETVRLWTSASNCSIFFQMTQIFGYCKL